MLRDEVRERLAADLAQAERSRVPISPLTDGQPDIDVVDAYEIQLINIRQRVAEGARVIGHKVGLSSEAMQKMMNVDEPDYGHLLDDMQVFEDRPVKSANYLYPRVEVEVEIPNQRRALRVCHLQTGDTRAFHRERMCASTCRLNTTLHSH